MSPEQERHLGRLNKMFALVNSPKYIKGQEEHGGNLYDMTPFQFALNIREEAIDLFNYAQSLIDKLESSITDLEEEE